MPKVINKSTPETFAYVTSNKFYSSVIKDSPSIIAVIDKKYNILTINRTFTGVEEEIAIGESYLNYILPSFHKLAKEMISKVFETGEPTYFISKTDLPNGTFTWFENNLYPVSKENETVAVSIHSIDITKQKELEEQLNKSEERLLLAQKIAHLCHWEWNIVTNELIWSDEIYNMFCIPKKIFGATYESFLKMIHPDDVEKVKQSVDDALKRKKPYNIDHRIVLPGGTIRYVHEQAEIHYDENDRPIRMTGTVHDITGQKQIELALRESEDKYRSLVEGTEDLFTQVDLNGKLIFVNHAAKKIFGFEPEECIGQTAFMFIHPDDRERTRNEFKKWLHNNPHPLTIENRQVNRNGTIFNVIWTCHKVYDTKGNIVAVNSIARDITERKNTEEKIRKSEERLRFHLERSPIGYIEWDGNFCVSAWNKSAERIFGYSKKEAMGKHASFIIPTLIREEVDQIFEDLMKKSGGMHNINENITKANEVITCEWYNTTMVDKDENVLGIASLVDDITIRVNAQKSLKENEQKLREIVNKSPIPMTVIDKTRNVLEYNVKFIDTYGYTIDDVPCEDDWWVKAYPDKEYRELVKKTWSKATQIAEKTNSEIKEQEWKVTCKDGTVKDVIFSYMPLGNVSLITMLDITDMKRLQEMEARTQRMETAGKIAGQISHDFNNLLGPLMAYPELIKAELPSHHPSIPLLDDIEHCANQMSEINQQLLALGTKGYYVQEPMNLNEIMFRIVRELKLPTQKIKINLYLSSDLKNIKGGHSQIYRAVMNIVLNAMEAMPDGGEITLETMNIHISGIVAKKYNLPPGDYVKITIQDTGKGIPEPMRSKIFEPFSTTKKSTEKRGAGLGLSVVHTVMNDHNGYIDFTTEISCGTIFKLYFPALEE